MKKLFLLAAVCCLVMNSWADCQLIGNEIPSGTGVNARSIINIQYDKKTHILSFEDIYEPDFTAYERSYQVYFYEYSPDYAFYQNLSGGANNPVFYGGDCNDDAFIPGNNSTGSTNPSAHPWTIKYVNNCAGGVISIDLSEKVPQLTALGYNHVMVGIAPYYKISASSTPVFYSTYGDWHFWLMNTAHFRIDPWVDHIEGLVTEVHTPTGVIGTGLDSPFEEDHHVYLCEGQDTAKIHANIFPTSDVTRSVTYIWQERTDDETAWHYRSQGTFTKTVWNNAVSAKSPLYADRNFLFSVGDMERVTYFRLALVYDYDTLYSEEIQIDAKSRIKITGPVACKLGDEAWKNINIKGAYPIFDTLTYEVDKSDTIRLKPYKSNWSSAEMDCSIPTGGSITTDSEGNPCITDIWYSCSIAISGETHSVKLYVDGTLYHSFNEVPCSFTIKECNYPAPADPTKSGADFLYWRRRDGSSDAQMSYITNHAVIGDEEWDAVFEISAISLNFIAYPEAGDAVPEKDYTTTDAEVIANWISCPADANYTIKSVTFYSADGNYFPEVRFNPNTTYMVQALVVPKAGYTFPVDANGYPIQSKIIVTNDYGAGTFYDLNVFKNNGGSLGFCVLFTTGDAPMVATPTFNHNASWIKDSQTFTLSCGTEGAAIYYTLDGTVPSATNGTLYTEPFTIDVTPSNVGQEQVIKAIAIKGEESSEVVTKTYNMVFNKRPIYITSVLHGSVSVVNAQSLYTPFDEIELAIAPETGYELESLDVYNNGNISEKVTVTDNKFVMPKFDVRVTAKFKEQADAAVDQVELAPKAQKVMVDGVFYILRGDKIYNATGVRVK